MSGRNSVQKREMKKRLLRGRTEAKCCYCKHTFRADSLTLEHVIPLSVGGGWKIENLKLACRTCNTNRGSLPVWLFIRMRNRGEFRS
jgi:5-methylcytosine-specific restriction endonuclease McrA